MVKIHMKNIQGELAKIKEEKVNFIVLQKVCSIFMEWGTKE